jgi:hypothetical protein
MPIYIEFLSPRQSPIPVRLGLVQHGRNTFFRIISDNGQIDMLLRASATDFIDLLEPKLESLKAAAGLAPPGIVRAPAQTEQYRHTPANEIDITDIREDMSAPEKLAIIIRRFENSPANLTGPYTAGFVDDLKAIYKKRAGHSYEERDARSAPGAGPGQLEADVAKVRPHLAEIRKPSGALHQGKIADLLELPQTGGSYRRRIVAVCEALEAAA